MISHELSMLQQLKISCLSLGIRIAQEAEDRLSDGGKIPLSIHEYATTGGVTLALAEDVFINAPFDEWYCDHPEATLTIGESPDEYTVQFMGDLFPARVLPLPGYLEVRDERQRLVREVVMSHVDRARISPVAGCSFGCMFCDTTITQKYARRPLEQLLGALEVARQDDLLPVKHVLISGGTPNASDYGYYDDVCEHIIRTTNLPVDVMMWPRPDNIIDRLADWGINGYALNLEVYDEDIARHLVPQKRHFGVGLFAEGIQRALARVGGNGRVRSLIIVGLEPIEKTLEGVEFLARLGCDPCLSPFRPGRGTHLQNMRPPSPEDLSQVYLKSLEIVSRYGVKLGPRCIPCQHNTLAFPDGSGVYYYS